MTGNAWGLIDARRRALPSLIVVTMVLSLFAVVPPASAEAIPPPRLAQQDRGTDITDDGSVSNVDIMEVVNAWTNARESGVTCGDIPSDVDINGDGCIDIVDVQTVSARVGRTVDGAGQAQAEKRSLLSSSSSASVAQATGTTLVVNSTGDEPDAALGDGICRTAGGSCTLRAAIAEANRIAGPNTIAFNISGGGPHSIHIATELPSITDESGATTIDGYTSRGRVRIPIRSSRTRSSRFR